MTELRIYLNFVNLFIIALIFNCGKQNVLIRPNPEQTIGTFYRCQVGENFRPATILEYYTNGSFKELYPSSCLPQKIRNEVLGTETTSVQSIYRINSVNRQTNAGIKGTTPQGSAEGSTSIQKEEIEVIYTQKGHIWRLEKARGDVLDTLGPCLGRDFWSKMKEKHSPQDSFSIVTAVLYCDSGFTFKSKGSNAEISSMFEAGIPQNSSYKLFFGSKVSKLSSDINDYNGQPIGYALKNLCYTDMFKSCPVPNKNCSIDLSRRIEFTSQQYDTTGNQIHKIDTAIIYDTVTFTDSIPEQVIRWAKFNPVNGILSTYLPGKAQPLDRTNSNMIGDTMEYFSWIPNPKRNRSVATKSIAIGCYSTDTEWTRPPHYEQFKLQKFRLTLNFPIGSNAQLFIEAPSNAQKIDDNTIQYTNLNGERPRIKWTWDVWRNPPQIIVATGQNDQADSTILPQNTVPESQGNPPDGNE